MNILLGITGSTGIKAIPKLFKRFINDGHLVKIITTPSARKLLKIILPNFDEFFITEEDEILDFSETGRVAHIDLARWADVMVIAPCTSNTYNKYHLGICDNFLLTTLRALETNKPVILAPAMNTIMLEKDINSWLKNNIENERIVYPTVKRLSCGDFGLGALADIDAIAAITYDDKWRLNWNLWHPGLIDSVFNISISRTPLIGHPGSFGATRKHDIHTGIDLYALKNSIVYAFEPGEIVSIGPFTGLSAKCDWWNDSQYVSVQGKSGIIVYGEVNPISELSIGQKVHTGQKIGKIVQVLKHKPREKVFGHSMWMLHVELLQYPGIDPNTGEPMYIAETWSHGKSRSPNLLDPTPYLYR